MQITKSSIWVCPWPLLSLRKPSPILGDQPTPVSGFPTLVEKWQMMSLLFSSILLPVYWVSLTAKVSLKASSHVNWKNHRHGAVVVLVQPTVLPDWKLAFRRKAFPIWLIFGCLEKLQVGQQEGLHWGYNIILYPDRWIETNTIFHNIRFIYLQIISSRIIRMQNRLHRAHNDSLSLHFTHICSTVKANNSDIEMATKEL